MNSQRKVRVLFVNSATQSGADTQIHFLALKNLDPNLFERFAAGQPPLPGTPSPSFGELSRIPGVTIRATDFGPSLPGRDARARFRAAFRVVPASMSLVGLSRYIRREGIEILHATDRPRDAMACALLAAMTGAKSVIHVHVKYGDWMSRGVRWAFGRADALVGVSDFVKRSLVDAGYSAERVHAVPNAIDVSRWDPALDPGPGRRVLETAIGAPLVVSVARLFHWKGHAELVRALPLVKKELPGVRLAIVGADYPAGSGVSNELRALAAALGVGSNLALTGQRADIASLLAASDVFALPSFEEPFGLVFAEAMAMKRPVVALDNGGTPEVVTHGTTGLLSPPGNIQVLAENLLTLLTNPALRSEMGEKGRLDVERRFHAGRLARDLTVIYSTLARSVGADRS